MNKISKKIRNAAIGTLAAVGSIGAVAATDATPVSAATAVTFCFTYQNPPTFTTYANKPVFLYDRLPSGEWRLIRQGTTNSNGCGTFFNTNPTVPMLLKAYTTTAFQTWESGYHNIAAGNGAANLGNLPVFRTR